MPFAFYFEIESFVIESPQILRAGKNACLETQLVLMYMGMCQNWVPQ